MAEKETGSGGTTIIQAPDTYSHRGAQTPTYTAPPMPSTAPVKPSNSSSGT